jgi:hypothetical protein
MIFYRARLKLVYAEEEYENKVTSTDNERRLKSIFYLMRFTMLKQLLKIIR